MPVKGVQLFLIICLKRVAIKALISSTEPLTDKVVVDHLIKLSIVDLPRSSSIYKI